MVPSFAAAREGAAAASRGGALHFRGRQSRLRAALCGGGLARQCEAALGQVLSYEVPCGLGVTPLRGEHPRESAVTAEQRCTLVELSSGKRNWK